MFFDSVADVSVPVLARECADAFKVPDAVNTKLLGAYDQYLLLHLAFAT
jgi:hypothetical protein